MHTRPVGVDIRLMGGFFLIVGAVEAFGNVSKAMSQFALGFFMLDSRFIASTALFVHGFWHRHLYTDRAAMTSARPSVSEGTH